MKLAPLLTELQPQQNGFRRAQRIQQIGFHRHIIVISGIPSGYSLLRTVVEALSEDINAVIGGQYIIEERRAEFLSLSDLFAYAKLKGFFEEVAPYALGWTGYTEWNRKRQNLTSDDDDDDEESNYEEEDEELSWIIRDEDDIEARWDALGKNETIVYDDELFDNGSYEFIYDRTGYDDDDID